MSAPHSFVAALVGKSSVAWGIHVSVMGSRKVSHESLTKERGHGRPETYFTSQGYVTQSTLKLKQEVKSIAFHVAKPKLDFVGPQPMHDLPMPLVLEAAFDARSPHVSFLSLVAHCLRQHAA